MQAKKSLGQHFLRDKKILQKIVDTAEITNESLVIEIGPGEGTLTELLIQRAKKVISIEKDKRMVELLKDKFNEEIREGKFEIIESDILEINISEIIKDKYILVGNIPYNITGSIFKKFLQGDSVTPQPISLTFVVQKEVAERIVARDKKESVLSISVKIFGEPIYGGIIKAGSFSPPPKVDSAIISVKNISKNVFKDIKEEINFFEVLKKGFSHKRKLLMSNLETNQEVFNSCGIGIKARAEDISKENWICLSKKLV